MTTTELLQYIQDKIGTPYSEDPSKGYTCLSWAQHLYDLWGKHTDYTPDDFSNLLSLRKHFHKVETPEFFDVALFNYDSFGIRHLGLMLDEITMVHCCESYNGVAKSEINRFPWVHSFKGFYRYA